MIFRSKFTEFWAMFRKAETMRFLYIDGNVNPKANSSILNSIFNLSRFIRSRIEINKCTFEVIIFAVHAEMHLPMCTHR